METQRKLIIFADDSSLFFRARSTTELSEIANQTLSKLQKWSKNNSLGINGSITKTVFVEINQYFSCEISLTIDHQIIEIVATVLTLGVYFSQAMSWDDRVQNNHEHS